jgi:hypothetical protein
LHPIGRRLAWCQFSRGGFEYGQHD